MKHLILIGLLSTASQFHISCEPPRAASVSGPVTGGSELLYRYQWELSELNGESIKFNINDSKAFLQFSPGQINSVSGSTSCNRLTGSFELSGSNSITFKPLAITEMACLNNKIENPFLEMMGRVKNWSIVNNQLLLGNGQTILAKFNAIQLGDAKLNGTWEMNYITGKRIAFEGLYPNKKPMLIFQFPSNEVRGNTSCNGFGGRVTIDGNKISFSNLVSTLMACEGNGEQSFVQALKNVVSYSFTDENTLVLHDKNGMLMRFTRK
jgi:heat shock protein HslJ